LKKSKGTDLKTINGNQFQTDLIKQKYHILNLDNAKIEGYYPRELLEIIDKLAHFEKKVIIEIGKIYSVRAFFAISEPKDNEVEYQSGYLDLKMIMHENQVYVGEVVTELPPMFVLKKGSKIKVKKENIVYQPNYK
jgi:hypothetical protein